VKHSTINASIALILGLGLTLALLWLLTSSLPARADPDILYVTTDGDDTNDCSTVAERCYTVQRAVDLATTDDEVWGVGGIYTEGAQVDIGPDEFLAELSVTKQADPDSVPAGAPLTYTIHVTNTGNVTLTATITDILPGHVTPTGLLTWTTTITAPDGVWTETVVVTVEMGYAGPLTNVVQVTTTEGAMGIYTETSEVQVTPMLEVSKQADPSPVQDGAQLTYTLRVTNSGNVTLTTTIADTLPDHVTPTGVLTWTPTITAPGGVWTQQVVVTVTSGYTGSLTNVVLVTTEEGATGKASVTVCANACRIYLPVVLKNYPLSITGIICRPNNDSVDMQGNKVFLPTRHFDKFGYDHSGFWATVINPQTGNQIEAQIIAFGDSNSMQTWDKCDFALKKTMRLDLGGDLDEVVYLPFNDRPPRTLIFIYTVPTQD